MMSKLHSYRVQEKEQSRLLYLYPEVEEGNRIYRGIVFGEGFSKNFVMVDYAEYEKVPPNGEGKVEPTFEIGSFEELGRGSYRGTAEECIKQLIEFHEEKENDH